MGSGEEKKWCYRNMDLSFLEEMGGFFSREDTHEHTFSEELFLFMRA